MFASGAVAADFPQGLVLHFNFDQMDKNNVIVDQSDHGHGRACGVKWNPAGKSGGAGEFDATNSHILIAGAPALNVTQATFAVWFKTAKSGRFNRSILDKGEGGGLSLEITGEAGGGKLKFTVGNVSCLSDSPVADGDWHHGAATVDDKNLKIHLDGKLQKQAAYRRGTIPIADAGLVIGLKMSGPAPQAKDRSFDGLLDDLMIFNRALSEEELRAVIASAKPKFTREQVARHLSEIKDLYDRGLILKDFYDRKVRECETAP